ncbi:MAG: UPF0182 family protein [Clostridiales Family XIII bacterium]|jgi:uncharacterized membrane protein (UPF0182 family)|nr:UPF0182 family protein [Clostridiales Family XIII bacterium]
MARIRKTVLVVLAVLLVLAAIVFGLSGFITDILWFRDLGYLSVFLKKLLTQLVIGIPLFAVLFALSMIYLSALRKGYRKRLVVESEKLGQKGHRRLAASISALCALAIALMTANDLWFTALQFTNSTGFGIEDPIFGLDVSFYVFKLQFIHSLNNLVIIGIVVFAITTFVYYALLLSLAPPRSIPTPEPPQENPDDELEARRRNAAKTRKSAFSEILKALGINVSEDFGSGGAGGSGGGARIGEFIHIASKQIVALGILFFLMLAVNFFLRQFDLLYTQTDVLFGAGFADINVMLWVYRILAGLGVVGAIAFTLGVARKNIKTVFAVPALMIALGVLGFGADVLVQQLVVSPDAINKESKYLAYNIEFTQNAYDLGDVSVKTFAAANNLTSEDIVNNTDTIRNIRINDYEPAKTFYNSTQSIRQYYDFNDVDVDRYMINGEYTQTFLTAREIDESKVPQQWLNLHLKYTHGYGITLSRVDKVTTSGQPDLLIKNIPPESSVPEIQIDRPEIYFGELSDNYIVVGTNEEEFDYPEGDSNVYTKYEGDSGIKMTLLNKLLFAIRERSMKLLVSSNITSESRIVINRNIVERVSEIMPYLSYSEPYMVTANGKLYWIIDAYTTSSYYPYSEPYQIDKGDSTNYIRNSVKVVIDAYTGDTGYYLVDGSDPIANTFSKIYPALFKKIEDMPDGVAQHIRYPDTLLSIQADIYKRYHVNDVKVFYLGEDRWDIAKEKLGASDTEVEMMPNYYIMKLPGEDSVEFINSIPYTPKDKNNMTGLLVARNDGENYGELILYQLPKGQIVMGPSQIDAQIAQDTEISQDFALWENSGSTYSRGNMFVIPIEESIMYIEPIYLKAANSSLPEVKRVIIYYDDRIAYGLTLAAALDEMFGKGTGEATASLPTDENVEDTAPPPEEGSGGGSSPQLSQSELISAANDELSAAENAQKNGDWAAYGEHLESLKGYLNQLATADGE